METVLSVCTNLQILVILLGYMLSESIDYQAMSRCMAPLPLTQLSTHLLDKMFTTLSPSHVLFTRLTHLELGAWPDGTALAHVPSMCESIALIPQLTHLSFLDNILIPMCPRILETCPSLRVLISSGILTIAMNDPDTTRTMLIWRVCRTTNVFWR
ncbi:hypothetical protein B0H16DRAFT_1528356 [Mycena metata]|uniref:Uncharacterized protein n=1 Tax=Mycena metata TaxID=1033252 RepID=A0AAD7JEG3_9AGAR|nr:hypothetical protein B0H16DRAFT_1528356 [Mycena metata]